MPRTTAHILKELSHIQKDFILFTSTSTESPALPGGNPLLVEV